MARKTFLLFSIISTCFCLNGYSQNHEVNQGTNLNAAFPRKEVVVINSGFAEARPLISFDGNALYFSRRYHPKNAKGEKDFQDVWVSYLDSLTGQWSEPENLGPVINNKKRNAIASLSPDGMDGIFFNTYKNTKRMPLVKSRKSGNSWTKPRVLNIENYVNVSDYSDYYIDFSNKILILAIQADSTVGDQDLYISFLDPYGGWKEPVNMGIALNTEKAEFAPFIGADDRFLFFCSYGHNGMGGSDIYMSVRLDDTWLNWSEPVNLGPGINSEQEETYFSITGDYKYLYYTSYPAKAKDRNISRVELPEDFLTYNGPVLANLDSSALSNFMLSEGVKISNPDQAIVSNNSNSSEDNRGNKDSLAGKEEDLEQVIAMEIEKAMVEENPVSTSNSGLSSMEKPQGLTRSLSPAAEEVKNYLQGIFPELNLEVRQKQDTVEFKIVENMLYEFNSVYVKSEYLDRLRKMASVLQDRQELKVQLIGHTDNVGSEEVNKRIARQRVENLVSYFRDRRISSERIEVIGAGPVSPVSSNDNEEGRMQNRRVETVIRFMEK